MKKECKRCKHKWEYTGNKKPLKEYPVYVTCPKCRTLVRL